MKAIRVVMDVESDTKFLEHTGKITKTLIYTLVRELRTLRGIRGVVSPVHISPLFRVGKRELELGELASPIYKYKRNNVEDKIEWFLEPIEVSGEYILHVGGEDGVVGLIADRLESLRNPLSIKVGDSIVTYRIEKVVDVTNIIDEKIRISSRIRVYLKSPALIFNIYTSSRLPKFSPTALEILAVPYMFANNIFTFTTSTLVSSSRLLGNLVETWYSLNSLKPVMVPFKGKREAALMGSVTYIVEARSRESKERIRNVLVAAELVGIGESRQNGFGTVVVQSF